MATITKQLAEELRSECGHTFEEILARKSDDDYRQLRSLLAAGAEADPAQLQGAIHLLGRWGDVEVVPEIVALIPRLEERVVMTAVNALGRLGGDEALQAVVECEDHESPDVRRFVVSALDQIGTEAAVERLTAMSRSDRTGFVRAKAKKLLLRRSGK